VPFSLLHLLDASDQCFSIYSVLSMGFVDLIGYLLS
jgi:hypothetical protein